jgi:transcriptional regulator with XRE-family HTH domain
MTPERIGGMVKTLRQKRGLTQEALAKAAGVTRVYVAKIEAGEKIPSIPTLRKLAKALKVKAGRLLD